jgi:putative endonuclease
MAQHNDLGRQGEEIAVQYLLKKGYVILETNWVYQKAEIDIIAQKGKILSVVEVKTRSSLAFGLPQEFVNKKKIRLLVKAVNEYIEMKSLDVEARFDIISIYNSPSGFEVEHLEDAFFYF